MDEQKLPLHLTQHSTSEGPGMRSAVWGWLAVSHWEPVEWHSKHKVGIMEQKVAILVFRDTGYDNETQLDIVQALLCLGILHHNGAEEVIL